ncbi:MAG: putative aminohydrolase SsnA [Chloroflexi bacterium]|nr:putative aminohydrolase SsnA [Chloroflexota bacterium]
MLIINATVITWGKPNQILPEWGVYINAGKISDLGPQAELIERYPGEPQIDAQSQLVMPGNICAHTHFYGTFSRGMAIPGASPANFSQILEKLWWPLDKSLTEDDVRYSALLCQVDAIKHGTTTLVDHHASPNFIDGSLDVIAETVELSGIRAALCYEVTDRDGLEKARAGIAENVRFIRSVKNRNSNLAAVFGLHAPLTLSSETLDQCRAAVGIDVGFHTHVSESKDDGQFTQKKVGTRPLQWLNKHGILGPHSIAAHCIHVDSTEMEILAETQTWVTHQPRSNMNNAVGVSPVEQMLNKGIKVCIGNDGFSNAMWEEWKTAYLVHKLNSGDPRSMGGETVTNMAIYNNSALAKDLFAMEIGIIKNGAAADLIFVDYDPPTPLSSGNLPWHILFGFRDSMVTTTIVNGKVLMKDRILLTLDEKEITAKSRELSAKTWERYNEKF